MTADEFAVRSVSLWVVADLDSEQGRLAAHSALSYLVWYIHPVSNLPSGKNVQQLCTCMHVYWEIFTLKSTSIHIKETNSDLESDTCSNECLALLVSTG